MICLTPSCDCIDSGQPLERNGHTATCNRLARKIVSREQRQNEKNATGQTFTGTVSFKKRPLNEFDKELISGLRKLKKSIRKVGNKNTFECSDGTRVTQVYINKMRALCYSLIDTGVEFPTTCWGCGQSSEGHAHIIPQARCKILGKTQLIWHPENIFNACNACNSAIENPKGQAWKRLKNIDKCMAFIKLHDTELYTKFLLNGYKEGYSLDRLAKMTIGTHIGINDIHGKPIKVGDRVRGPHQLDGTVEFFPSLTWDSGGSSHPGFYCREWMEGETDMDYHSSFREVEII